MAFVVLTNGTGALFGYFLAALFADRRPKRSLLRFQALALAVLSVCTAMLAAAFGFAGDWFYLLAALFGVAQGVAVAVLLGWTAEILPRQLIAKGVAVMALAGYAQSILTAVPGVFFRGHPGAVVWFFGTACAAYLLTALAVSFVRSRNRERADAGAFAELSVAVKYLWSDARLKSIWLYALLASAALVFVEAAILDLLWVEHGFRSWDYTLPYIIRGATYFISTVVLVFLIGSRRRWTLFISAAAVLGIAVTLLAASSAVSVLTLLMGLFGLVSPIVFIGLQALGLSVTRSFFFGRVAALMLFVDGLLDFGAGFLRVHLDDLISGRNAVLAFGLVLALLAGWLWHRWRQFRRLPEDPDAGERRMPPMLLAEIAAPQKPTDGV